MTSNLPVEQKTNWVSTEVVLPQHTNGWGTAINQLSDAIPIYASCGNYYKATYTNNIYQLTPLTHTDNTTNEVVVEYIDGMSVVFQCPSDNLADCSINVNSLGVKSIKSVYNTNLAAGILRQGAFVELIYDKANNYFKFEQDLSKAQIDLSNINNSGRTVIDDRIDSKIRTLLNVLYPVGSIYISVTAQCPLASLGIGTWVLKSSGRVLQGSSSAGQAGSLISASLPTLKSDDAPNHSHGGNTLTAKGTIYSRANSNSGYWGTILGCDSDGVFTSTKRKKAGEAYAINGSIFNNTSNDYRDEISLNTKNKWSGSTTAAGSHSHNVTWVGHVGTTVQPNAYVVNIWERTA